MKGLGMESGPETSDGKLFPDKKVSAKLTDRMTDVCPCTIHSSRKCRNRETCYRAPPSLDRKVPAEQADRCFIPASRK